MYIDPKIQFPNDSPPDPLTGARTASTPAIGGASKGGSVAPASTDGDTVSLSSTHGEIQTLTASLANVPEIRTDRVDSLREQVGQGTYQPSSQRVADAIVREYSRVSQLA